MSDPTPDPSQELHARRASSFGGHAAAYAEHRPDYPRNALLWGLSGATGEPRRVLDLAAGTGKVTVGLTELGLDVTAVEPDHGMLAELSRILPAVTALTGHAERIPLPDAAMDAVFVGQAFHWFDVQPALTEIARVLRPGGVLVPLWNHEDESVPWVAEYASLGRTRVSQAWVNGTQADATHPAFEPFESRKFHHVQRRTADSLLETFATHSHVLVAPPDEAAAAITEIREFLATNPATSSGEFDLPIITTTFRARRI